MDQGMMIKRIRQLSDSVLLNAFALETSGLYYGKAGVALSLFGVAYTLKDEYIEEKAFELLQESLMTENMNVEFKKGLSGIGFVLQFLKEMNWIDLDYMDIYGAQTRCIIQKCSDVDSTFEKYGISGLEILSFLYYIKTEESLTLQYSLIKKAESHMKVTLDNIGSNRYSLYAVVMEWEFFLRKTHIYPLLLDWDLLCRYRELCQQGTIPNNIFNSFYIDEILGEENQESRCVKTYKCAMNSIWEMLPFRNQLQYFTLMEEECGNMFSIVENLYINKCDCELERILKRRTYMKLP